MKKAYELSVLTGTQVFLLVVSEPGLSYTFTTPKLQPLVTKAEGKNLIQACLNAPEPAGNGENGVDEQNTVDSPEEPTPQHLPPQQNRPNIPQQANMHPGYMPQTLQEQQALAYQKLCCSTTKKRGLHATSGWYSSTTLASSISRTFCRRILAYEMRAELVVTLIPDTLIQRVTTFVSCGSRTS